MCGRFTLTVPAKLRAAFPNYRFPSITPRYNIAPAQPILALPNTGENEAQMMVWGMSGNINARAETVASKPSFRHAAREHRAIVFADGYYEWKAFGDGKQPYYIRRPGGEPFTFAALWDDELAGAERVRTCTLITTEALPSLRTLHDRMPLILSAEARERWLDPKPLEEPSLNAILHEGNVDLESYPVSLAVNRVANDTPVLIERAEPPEQESLF